jgi:predicted RNase H-like HicB family nuclease
MPRRYYPAVLERDVDGLFAVWFPDFPGCVAAAADQEAAVAKAHDVLAQAIEDAETPPDPTPFEAVETPDDADVITLFAMGVTPPSVSERVNVYLPKALIERLDEQAEARGMSRSSFVGYAVSLALGDLLGAKSSWMADFRKKQRQGR